MDFQSIRSPDRTKQTCISCAMDILCAAYALDWQAVAKYKINLLYLFIIPTIFPLTLHSTFYTASSGLAKNIIIFQCSLLYELWTLRWIGTIPF